MTPSEQTGRGAIVGESEIWAAIDHLRKLMSPDGPRYSGDAQAALSEWCEQNKVDRTALGVAANAYLPGFEEWVTRPGGCLREAACDMWIHGFEVGFSVRQETWMELRRRAEKAEDASARHWKREYEGALEEVEKAETALAQERERVEALRNRLEEMGRGFGGAQVAPIFDRYRNAAWGAINALAALPDQEQEAEADR